jgi:toxin CptA
MHGPALALTITPSRWLRLALLGLHVAAVAAVLLADLAIWVHGLLLAGIVASLVLRLRQPPPLQLRCEADGSLLVQAGTDWQPAAVLASTMVTPNLTVLHYRPEGSRRAQTAVILPDSLPADDFRRLRVWLRWKAKVPGPGAATITDRSADTPEARI